MSSELVNIIFGMKVRQARIEANLTRGDLAEGADLSLSYLTEIEKGRKYPRADKILRMAETLGVEYDTLVSIKLDPSMTYLSSALSSPLLSEFPFEEFSLDESQLVNLLTQAPVKASALLHAISEISRQYDLKDEHFLWAMLRSYQEIHENYFPELEEAAADFAREVSLESRTPVTLDVVRDLIEDRFDYELEDQTLAGDPTLRGYRSIFVRKQRPRLFVNNLLRPRQLKFLLAREIGYQYLDLKERSYTSSPDRVDSFQQALNDFRASYFSGALLIPLESIRADIHKLFSQEVWRPQLLLDMLDRYRITPEMLLYRFSELAGQFFGLGLHFLRLHKAEGRYQVVKRLNMSRLPIPSGLALHEHQCRRWLSARLLQALDERRGTEEVSERPLIGVQMSEFLESQDRYLSLGFARPLVLSPQITSSVVVGFRVESDLAQVIRFARDPAVPLAIINETCERCPLSTEQCEVRAAEPFILREQQLKQDRQEAVEQLMAR
ncbi:MAG: ImmA/IrrE family metallo-endopeptidase [Chloroflexota bacterium]|nr:MAG: ImmA/IrrE family metallo-endopeptidase [Chloroflexota bacterium]